MAVKISTYGITISDAQLVLVLFATIESNIAHEYGCEFQPTMAAIHKLFEYNYIHTANSLKTITEELGSANSGCDMKAAPLPSSFRGSNGIANTVDDRII